MFSRAVGRKEHCKQISLPCGECSWYMAHTGFAPARWCVLSRSTLLRCSAGAPSKVGPAFCALPRCKPLRFRFSGTPQRCRHGWACILCPSQVQAAQATRCLVSTLSQVGVHLITSLVPAFISGVPCVSSGELISDCDPPGGCQLSRIPGRRG